MKRALAERRIVRGLLALTLGAACAPGVGGCAGYSTYPASEGGGIGADSPNAPHMADVMLVGLRTVIERYPVEGEYVINFPEGMWPRKVAYVMERLDDPNAMLVNDLGDRVGYVPVYHVSRVMVRLGRAEVDIQRPVLALSTPGGEQVYQVVTVYMSAGTKRWAVDRSRSWTIGAIPAPPLHMVGDTAQERGMEPASSESSDTTDGAGDAGAGGGE